MKTMICNLIFLFTLLIPIWCQAIIHVGIGKADITPPIGTPSAGYVSRKGAGMEGVHDPLLAISLFIDNGEKKIILCSVDHLGFPYEMTQAIIQKACQLPQLKQCEIYIDSSHTHSGGGAYLNIPGVGEALAGPYNPEIAKFYVDQTVKAIVQSTLNPVPAKVGIGYGNAEDWSQYRSDWPTDVSPLSDIAIIKVTKLDNSPLAVLFNYPVHPTLLTSQNRLFSSDFVGYARDHLQSLLGCEIQPLYFNGAQAEILPVISNDADRFEACKELGQSLAEAVKKIWEGVEAQDSLEIQTQKDAYTFKPQAPPEGSALPVEEYKSEINLIVFNHREAFITIPGELSTIYDRQLKEMGKQLGYHHVSIFGLTNDAHGYIILPEAWARKTAESKMSYGGEQYGIFIKNHAEALLKQLAK